MRRIERLVNLLAALIDTDRPLSRADIARRVPGYAEDEAAFRRAFERDKELLRSMGIPLTVEPLDPRYPEHGDGYRVPKEQYSLPDPGLTSEEVQALALAASAVKLKSQAAAAALWKLGGDPKDVAATTDVELTDDERLAEVFMARRERKRMCFRYRGTERELDPHRISFRNGHWYVTGYDHRPAEVRTYRLDRIESQIDTTTTDSFVGGTTNTPWLPPWQMGDAAPVRVHVLIDASQATFAIDQAGFDKVVDKRGDGSVVLELEVTNREALFSFVLGFLDHATILRPADVRDELVTYLRGLVRS